MTLNELATRIYVYETLYPNRCEPSIEVNKKMGVQWEGGGFGVWVCQGGCKRRIEVIVIVKIQKKNGVRG